MCEFISRPIFLRWRSIVIVLMLLCFGSTLQAQHENASAAEALRVQLGMPELDAPITRDPVQRIRLIDLLKSQTRLLKPDSSALNALVFAMRQSSEDSGNSDLALLAELLVYYSALYNSPMDDDAWLRIDYLNNLYQNAQSKDSEWDLLEVGIELADAYSLEAAHYEVGVMLSRELAGLVEKQEDQLCPRKQYVFFHLGLTYLVSNDPENAVRYIKRALQVQPTEVSLNISIPIINHLGLAYRDWNMLDSSDIYFNRNLAICRTRGDSVNEYLTLGNLGENQYLRGNYEAALPLVQADAEMALKLNDLTLASNALMLLGDIYTRRGNFIKADSALALGLPLVRNTRSYPRIKKAYSIMERYYIATGQSALAGLYQDSMLQVADSLSRYFNRSRLSAAEAHYSYASLQKQRELEATEWKFMNLLLSSIVVVAILLILIGYQHQHRQRSMEKVQRLELEISLRVAEVRLEEARTKIEAYVEQLAARGMSDVNWSESRILTREQWKEFSVIFSASFPGYIERLKTRLPQLTDGEIRLCCLIMLGLRVKDIASILGVNENSAYKNRSRLLAKLQLSGEMDLNDILKRI